MPQRLLSESEFNDLKSKVLSAAPDGLKEDDFKRYVGPAMESAIGTAENSAAPLEGSALSRFAAGAWKNLNPIGLVSAVSDLPGTVKGIIDAHAAQLDKAKAAYADGRYSEAAGHLAATALPVIGPAAANAGERIASGDVAGGLGEGAGLIGAVEAPRLVKGAAKGVNAVATKVADSAAAQNAIGATGGAAAGASMGHPYIGMAIGSKYGGPIVKSVAEGVQAVTGGAPAAGAALSDLELARQEVAAGRLSPAVLRGMERAAAVRASRQAVPVVPPAAPVATAPPAEPIATAAPASPAVASPQPQAPPALDAAGQPAVTAQPPASALPNQVAINALGIAAKRAKLSLSLDEVKALVPLVEQGATPEQAIGAFVAQKAAADPAAALAAKLGTPNDAAVAARVADRNANGQWQAPRADMAARQQVLTEQRMAELRAKFGGRQP